MDKPIYEIYQDAGGKFRFRLRGVTNKILAIGEGYKTKDRCINGINAVKQYHDAAIKDLTIGETTLILDTPPRSVKKGSSIAFSGRLCGNGLGKGVVEARISIYESDSPFFDGTHLASGTTGLNGGFNIEWIAKKMDWWDNSVEIYAKFEGMPPLKASISEKHSISIC
ncbi:MAG: DUF1508 domain-containing protein [Candidatus Bathyarchaeota archaeon]|jgi:uncharacterized protein YegP (UPF0339 family)